MAIVANGAGSNPNIQSNSISGSSNLAIGSTYRDGIQVLNGAYPTIQDNSKIFGQYNYYARAIYIDSAKAIIKNNTLIKASESYGNANTRAIYLDNSSEATITQNGSIIGSDNSNSTVGIYIRNLSIAAISNNTYIKGGYSTGYGIYFYNCIGNLTHNITNNTEIIGSSLGTGYGIYFYHLDGNVVNITDNAKIIGTQELGSTGYGIYFRDGAGQNSQITISNNTNIFGTNTGGNGYGVYIAGNVNGKTDILGNTLIAGSKMDI